MHAYYQKVQMLLQQSVETEARQLEVAAEIIAEHIRCGGILQLFGCGHSNLLSHEVFYRAGGLVPVQPINIEPLTLQAGALNCSKNEKDPTIIKRYKDHFKFQDNDILLVISTSGVNSAPIDVALLGRALGVFVISLQSSNYSDIASNHNSGQRLEDVVDLVIDTHVPKGDGLLIRNGVQYGPASTVIGAVLLNTLISLVIEKIMINNGDVPVFKSANIEYNQTHNIKMIDKYKHRIDFE